MSKTNNTQLDNAKYIDVVMPQSKVTKQTQNRYLDYVIDPSFQRVNRTFILSFENKTVRSVHTWYVLPKVEVKDCNLMINGRNFFDQTIKRW